MRKFLALLFTVSFLLCGCTKTENEAERQNRFAVEYSQGSMLSSISIMIIRDTETGEAYLFVKAGYGGGLTALEEQEEIDGEKVVP